jgi:hypothetical protein
MELNLLSLFWSVTLDHRQEEIRRPYQKGAAKPFE